MNPQVENAKEFARKSWNSFRNKTGFYQTKVWLALAYALIVVVTIVLVPPSPVAAEVRAGSIPWGTGSRAFLDLKNIDTEPGKIFVHITGRSDGQAGVWQSKEQPFSEDVVLRLWPTDFTDDQGISPIDNLSIDVVDLRRDNTSLFRIDLRK